MRVLVGLALAAVGLALTGCETNWNVSSGSGGAGGKPPTTTVGATTGSGASCEIALALEPACTGCLEEQCCNEATACAPGSDCAACAESGEVDAAVCEADQSFGALRGCALDSCRDLCQSSRFAAGCDAPASPPSKGACVNVDGVKNQCNPITNGGCDAAKGEACDTDTIAGFRCFVYPGAAGTCEDCGKATGDKIGCAGKLTCRAYRCARFCCNDDDCGTGKCFKGSYPDHAVGACGG